MDLWRQRQKLVWRTFFECQKITACVHSWSQNENHSCYWWMDFETTNLVWKKLEAFEIHRNIQRRQQQMGNGAQYYKTIVMFCCGVFKVQWIHWIYCWRKFSNSQTLGVAKTWYGMDRNIKRFWSPKDDAQLSECEENWKRMLKFNRLFSNNPVNKNYKK